MIPTPKSPRFTQKTAAFISIAALGILTVVGCSQQPPSATVESSQPTENQVASSESMTLKNLQSAYNGESNAHVHYVAFAKKADEEGYKQVASLFRAAARAEEIHRDNHAKVIREMAATPENNITTPEVKSTAENLEAAIKGESYERDTMYPEFIKQAKAEGNQEAVQTFTYAADAEAQHAKFYTQAKNNLEAWREAKQPFYVCQTSGETTMNLSDTANCPKGNTKEQFEKVS
ncbi:ferritin family protein [Lyngbya aestuarii]|uniref:ferritin family protein n=1 Tax=Lyngbya aestuarii TaxID=118322 RepID=UPI00403D8CE5